MDNDYSPTILQGQHTNDDEILAKTPPLDPKALGGDSSVIIMELLQRFKVRDVMKRKIIAVSRDASLREAQRLMRENRISGLPVCEEGRLYGIVSVNDIINALDNGWIEDSCEKHMACNLVVLEAGMPISFALRYFNNYTYGRFPVLDSNRKLVGILSQRDVMRALLYELSVEIRKLERKTSNNAPTHATGECATTSPAPDTPRTTSRASCASARWRVPSPAAWPWPPTNWKSTSASTRTAAC